MNQPLCDMILTINDKKLAIALKLCPDDTADLLARAGYALSPGNKGDLIVRYFIEQGVHDIMEINFALAAYGQQTLG